MTGKKRPLAMLESNLDDTDDGEPQFPLSVTEAISVYSLYAIFLEDVLAGVEDSMSKTETPVQLRQPIREAIPNLVQDIRDFLTEHLAPELMTKLEEDILKYRKAGQA
jgi:hypothetical protein